MGDLLSDYPVAVQLYRLYLERHSGRMEITDSTGVSNIWLQEGIPVYIESNALGASPEDIIIEAGYCTQEKIRAAISSADTPPADTLDFLRKKNLITSHQLRNARMEVLGRNLAMLCLKQASTTTEKTDLPFAPDQLTPVNLFQVLFIAFRFFSTPEQVTQLQSQFSDKLLIPNSSLSFLLPNLQLPPNIVQALRNWSVPRTYQDFNMISGLNPREAMAVVALLKLTQVLELRSKPERRDGAENGKAGNSVHLRAKPVNTDSEVKRSQTTPASNGNKQPNPAPKPQAQPQVKAKAAPTLDPQILKLQKEIDAKLQAIKSHNPATILGVEPEASREEVKAAYSSQVRRFHPDRLSGIENPDLVAGCEKVFSALGNAYQTLSNPKSREEFLKAYKDPALKGNMHRAEQRKRAALDIEKVKILFKKRDYKQALEAAQRAHAIYPHDPTVLTIMAWAEFNISKNTDADREIAFDKIKQALRLDPKLELAHFGRAYILRLMGKDQEAIKGFELVLKLNPTHLEATRELKLLKSRQKN